MTTVLRGGLCISYPLANQGNRSIPKPQWRPPDGVRMTPVGDQLITRRDVIFESKRHSFQC